ncbi:retrotransposon protein, putative, ty1-copia subclass [Tanacetum coccineum]|uniref:Retrotransposon protein, putative, ty1-copia subclass n=1 Tax=Tanacetum coccineum TaxID=301880 RepID=A0ABQ5FQK0_9ASTR
MKAVLKRQKLHKIVVLKRAGDKLESDKSKKQKTDENEEVEVDNKAKLKKHMVTVKDDDIAIDAIPLAAKPPMIVEYKLIREGIMGHYQLIRADGSFKRYSSMIRMLQVINIKFRGGLLGLKDFKMILRITTAQMVVDAQNTNNTTIRSILQQEKLTGPNFTNWYQNLRIVLRSKGKLAHLEQPTGSAPAPATAGPDTTDKYYETVNLEQEVACLMLSSMSPDIQRNLEKYNAYDMLKELKTKMKSRLNKNCLKQLKHSTLVNKRKDYDQFVQNYNKHSMGKTIAELYAMLKLHEKEAKGKDKGKNKLAYAPKPKILSPPKRDNPAKDSVCHHYKEVGHWRRNCPSYQAELKKRKNASVATSDDFIRYGYVYLMKHKHEVFETFKVFQNEVENQLGKKIKAIRSDRGGEYLSHEFVNHMKSCGIVSQLTPPYTPQHNEVSERGNQTLLDMVQSMMNLTTLPKSFWGYALDSVACILNMVPTKKVERTPYEIWHGKAPKLSYLRVLGCEALVK